MEQTLHVTHAIRCNKVGCDVNVTVNITDHHFLNKDRVTFVTKLITDVVHELGK